jgi:endonuclease/exonuclease/phosphatase family metal-dependent hydrolase
LRLKSWEWLERAAAQLSESPAVILGDLNVGASSGHGTIGHVFRRILDSGWVRAIPPEGCSFFGDLDRRSEIDHILATPHCLLRGARYVTSVPGFTLAGSSDALSDHAALVTEIDVSQTP